tara:strand:+ start:114 stop:662 length:549 start_codon:yes stop_codon:yes gene_type:complete
METSNGKGPKNGVRVAGGGQEATTTLPEISWIWWYEVNTLAQFVQWIRCLLWKLHRDVHNMTVSLTSKGDTQKHVMYWKGVLGKECVKEVIRVRKILYEKWGEDLKYQKILLREIKDRREDDQKALQEQHRRCIILVYMREFIKRTKIDEESLSIWDPAEFKPKEFFSCIQQSRTKMMWGIF